MTTSVSLRCERKEWEFVKDTLFKCPDERKEMAKCMTVAEVLKETIAMKGRQFGELATAYLTGRRCDGNPGSLEARIEELRTRCSSGDFLANRSFDATLIDALLELQKMGSKDIRSEGKQTKLRITDKSIMESMYSVGRVMMPSAVLAEQTVPIHSDFEPILKEMYTQFKINEASQSKLAEGGYVFLQQLSNISVDALKGCGLQPAVAKKIVNKGIPWAKAESARRKAASAQVQPAPVGGVGSVRRKTISVPFCATSTSPSSVSSVVTSSLLTTPSSPSCMPSMLPSSAQASNSSIGPSVVPSSLPS
jgi:hypothetical protein